MPHDIFLAHAAADRASAEALFDLLVPDPSVWLDTRCLLPGDEWPVEIARAQRAALATVILVSPRADNAFYLRDEIHTAIALYRANPGEHRAVAVFLEGWPADPMQVPYGLRGLHGINAVAEGGLPGVARRLRELVARLRGLPLPAPPPPPVAAVDPPALHERLCRLTMAGQLDMVILHAGLPREHIRPDTAPLAARALDIVQLVDQGGPELAARVQQAIARVAPWLR